jgi:phosphatidylglycerol---prolipoprotein diacylglyceryl transferase
VILESLAAPASIPSPSENIVHLGPVPLHMYGLMLAIGILVAVRVAETRWVRRGHSAKEFSDIVIWIVVAGVIGARVYHVITDYQLFTDDWLKAFKIWEGGLGIWGAVVGGAIAAVILTRRRHLDLGDLLDCIAPGLLFAQAIGRWGNWFNQELFGAPTTLPWGLEIDMANRPHGYTQYATFQPTFLYESLYCLALGLALIWIDHHFQLKKFQLFAMYCMGYTAGRFVFEEMRIDPAHTIGPLRLNAWVSIGVFLGALIAYLWLGRHGTPVERVPIEDGSGISASGASPDSA